MEEKTGAFAEMTNDARETETVETAQEAKNTGGKRLKKSTGRVRGAVGIVLAVLLAVYLGLCAWAHFDREIAPNTFFSGVNYGGIMRGEAESWLEYALEQARQTTLSFLTAEENEPVAEVVLGELGIEVDVKGIVDTMAEKPYHGFFAGGAYYLGALLGAEREVTDHTYDDAFRAAAVPVLELLELEAVEFDAAVTGDGRVLVTKAKDGRALVEGAEETVAAALREAYFGGERERVLLQSVEEDAEGGVYEVVPARSVDLKAEREKLVSEKVNAGYDVENERITPSSVGVSFTLGELEAAYEAAAAGTTFTLTAAVVEQPEVTAEMLEECLFRDELSSYTTRVTGEAGRRKNVQLTSERINGYIINAGETMQYGPLVTPFSADNGYFPAPGYLNGKTVDMVGGGACQASSTLYAAALYADLEIVQRVNHGYASSYIGLGLDATVASGGPEFEFRNSTLYPIKVQAEFFSENGRDYVKVTLLGTKTDDHYVKMITEVLSTTPYEDEFVETDELAPGEQRVEQTPYTGYRVKTYRNVYAGDGTLLSSTYEATSNYKARNRITLVGKAAEPELPAQSGDVPAAGEVPAEETPAEETPAVSDTPAEADVEQIPEVPQMPEDGAAEGTA